MVQNGEKYLKAQLYSLNRSEPDQNIGHAENEIETVNDDSNN